MASNDGAHTGGGGSTGIPFEHLPEGWESTVDSLGQVYYFSRATGEVQWNRPEDVGLDVPSESGLGTVRGRADSVVSTEASDIGNDGRLEFDGAAGRQFGILPDRWESTVDHLGQVYYFNRARQLVQWNRPEEAVPDVPSESGIGSPRGRANSAVSTEATENYNEGRLEPLEAEGVMRVGWLAPQTVGAVVGPTITVIWDRDTVHCVAAAPFVGMPLGLVVTVAIVGSEPILCPVPWLFAGIAPGTVRPLSSWQSNIQ